MVKTRDPRTKEAFQLYLQQEFARRSEHNSQYSLRSFARSLKVDPSALSKILHGKRRVTYPTFTELALRLGLSPEQMSSLAPAQKLPRRKEAKAVVTLPEYKNITKDAVDIYSGWQHFAILELTSLRSFQPKISWIAKVLEISHAETQLAVDRLRRTGFLKIESVNGVEAWKDLSGSVTATAGNYANAALQQNQIQVLQKAIRAVTHVSLDKRSNSNMTMAINTERINEAKERIKNFRRELCEFLTSKTPSSDVVENSAKSLLDEVYHLSIALYPVSQAEAHSQN